MSFINGRIALRTPPGEARPAGTYRYGLGLIEIVKGEHKLLGHGGLFTGHTAALWHLPECG